MTKTAEGLVAWAKQAYEEGWVYWYGTCGYACTESLLKSKTKQYPDHYGESRMTTYRKHIAEGRVAADCIGLFKSYAWDKDGDIDTRDGGYGINGQPDKGAKQTLNNCKVKGDISTIPEIPGLAVWTKTGGHIGVYVGDGYVVEARGFGYNPPVQRNKLSSRSFTTWGLYPYTKYTEEQEAIARAAAGSTAGDNSTPTLRKGSNGDAVKELQNLLLSHGYELPKYGADGDYGAETVTAVKKFQKDNGLDADGICGPKTWAALKAAPAVKYSVTIPGLTKAVAEKIIAQYGGNMSEEV